MEEEVQQYGLEEEIFCSLCLGQTNQLQVETSSKYSGYDSEDTPSCCTDSSWTRFKNNNSNYFGPGPRKHFELCEIF